MKQMRGGDLEAFCARLETTWSVRLGVYYYSPVVKQTSFPFLSLPPWFCCFLGPVFTRVAGRHLNINLERGVLDLELCVSADDTHNSLHKDLRIEVEARGNNETQSIAAYHSVKDGRCIIHAVSVKLNTEYEIILRNEDDVRQDTSDKPIMTLYFK